MPKFKEGDRVRVVTREAIAEDAKTNRYFGHMAGLRGTVANIYADSEVAVQIDVENLPKPSAEVHKVATQRMREKFLANIGEESKKTFTKEELEFDVHFMLLVHGDDLEKI